MRRRHFLLGLPLAACGGSADTDGPAGDRADLLVLGPALELERTTIAAYEVGRDLASGRRTLIERILDHEREHAEAVAEAIRDLRGEPPAAQPAARYTDGFPPLRDERAFLRFAAQFERRTVETYAAALPRLETTRLHGLLSTLIATEAAHASALAEGLGRDPLERVLAVPA